MTAIQPSSCWPRTILPLQIVWMSIAPNRSALPVGASPTNGPLCVAVMFERTATLLPSGSFGSTVGLNLSDAKSQLNF